MFSRIWPFLWRQRFILVTSWKYMTLKIDLPQIHWHMSNLPGLKHFRTPSGIGLTVKGQQKKVASSADKRVKQRGRISVGTPCLGSIDNISPYTWMGIYYVEAITFVEIRWFLDSQIFCKYGLLFFPARNRKQNEKCIKTLLYNDKNVVYIW